MAGVFASVVFVVMALIAFTAFFAELVPSAPPFEDDPE